MLGTSDGSPSAQSFAGSDQPGPHQAIPAEFDQPGLSRSAGAKGPGAAAVTQRAGGGATPTPPSSPSTPVQAQPPNGESAVAAQAAAAATPAQPSAGPFTDPSRASPSPTATDRVGVPQGVGDGPPQPDAVGAVPPSASPAVATPNPADSRPQPPGPPTQTPPTPMTDRPPVPLGPAARPGTEAARPTDGQPESPATQPTPPPTSPSQAEPTRSISDAARPATPGLLGPGPLPGLPDAPEPRPPQEATTTAPPPGQTAQAPELPSQPAPPPPPAGEPEPAPAAQAALEPQAGQPTATTRTPAELALRVGPLLLSPMGQMLSEVSSSTAPTPSPSTPTPASPQQPARPDSQSGPAGIAGEGDSEVDSEAGGGSGRPGVRSDRDSDAFSIRTGEFRLGRVIAGQGLEVRTTRPEFSLVARSLTAPSSPRVELVFRRSGVVKRVNILRSSGYPIDIDEPLKTAMYAWRASGRALDELPDVPSAELRLVLTVNLR